MVKRKYDNELKKDIVTAYKESNKTLREFSEAVGIPVSTINKWVIKFGNNTKAKSKSEIELLREELYEVKMERDILKKSIAIFVKTQR